MATTKAYTCKSMPGLKLGFSAELVANFYQGKLITDNETLQKEIEGHKWYKVFIFDECPPDKAEVSSPASAPGGSFEPKKPSRKSARGRPPAEEVARIALDSIDAAKKALEKPAKRDGLFQAKSAADVIDKTAAAERTLPSRTVVGRCPLRQLEDIATEWEIDISVASSSKEQREIVKEALEAHWK